MMLLTADKTDLSRFLPLLDLMGRLEPEKEKLALAIYRGIAEHGMATLEWLSRQTGQAADEITSSLDESAGVYRDGGGNITGFWGLTASPVSSHKFIIGNKTLYAWCAWDTLFMPQLLNTHARVESVCAQSQTPIKLDVSPIRIESASSNDIVISMLIPEGEAFSHDVVGTFCHHVNFFRGPAEGAAWAKDRTDLEMISLDTAFQLGQAKNNQQFTSIR